MRILKVPTVRAHTHYTGLFCITVVLIGGLAVSWMAYKDADYRERRGTAIHFQENCAKMNGVFSSGLDEKGFHINMKCALPEQQ